MLATGRGMNRMVMRPQNDTSKGVEIPGKGFTMIKVFGLVDRKAYNANGCECTTLTT
jgi:hypothetical protein